MENTNKRYWKGIEELKNDIEFVKIKPEDQDFIAMARNIIPKLIDEIVTLKSKMS